MCCESFQQWVCLFTPHWMIPAFSFVCCESFQQWVCLFTPHWMIPAHFFVLLKILCFRHIFCVHFLRPGGCYNFYVLSVILIRKTDNEHVSSFISWSRRISSSYWKSFVLDTFFAFISCGQAAVIIFMFYQLSWSEGQTMNMFHPSSVVSVMFRQYFSNVSLMFQLSQLHITLTFWSD